MRILITNDDGIDSPSILRLAEWAKKLGEVTVAAPKTEQSGKSQAIDFRTAVEIKRVDLTDGVEAYSVDSTPADCVRFGVTGLHREYDIVFSGVNRGYNLGEDISYSGTVGAILESGRLGIRAIAFSCDVDCAERAFSEIDDVYAFITENGLLAHAELLNVNFPRDASKGFAITKQGTTFYTDEFVDCGNGTFLQVGEPVLYESDDISTDIIAIQNGYVSITPITAIKTDLAAYDKLKEIRK